MALAGEQVERKEFVENISIQVNGQRFEIKPEHHSWTLVRYLREELNQIGRAHV